MGRRGTTTYPERVRSRAVPPACWAAPRWHWRWRGGAARRRGGPAGAHATLIGTVPAADGKVDAVPAAVELRFDEPVETVEDAVQVFGPDGDRVDLGTVEADDGGATLRAPIEADGQGTYTVAWRVTSEDSHTLSGSFVFHNGTRTGAVDVGDEGGSTATSWLGASAAGSASPAPSGGRRRRARAAPPPPGARGHRGRPAAAPGSTGPAPAAAATVRPATRRRRRRRRGDGRRAGHPVSAGPGPHGRRRRPRGDRRVATTAAARAATARLRLLAASGAAGGAVGAALALVAIVAESSGRSMYDAVAIVARRRARHPHRASSPCCASAWPLAAAAAASSPALWRRTPVPGWRWPAVAGRRHRRGSRLDRAERAVAVASDVAHLGAVAVWIGGLVALLAVLPLLDAGDRVATATRFSALALGAVRRRGGQRHRVGLAAGPQPRRPDVDHLRPPAAGQGRRASPCWWPRAG